jgi:predicted ester cyclase
VHYTATGTQATAIGGVEPSGEPVTFDGMYLIEVTCGKVSHMWSAVDQLAQRNEGASVVATPVSVADEATPSECPALTDEAAATLMDAWYQQVWSGDFDTLATMTTADVYHHWATGPDTSGQADQAAHLQTTLDQFPGLVLTYDNLVVDGDYIAVHWGELGGDPNWGGLNIFRTECGSIAEVWSEMDLTNLPGSSEATPA